MFGDFTNAEIVESEINIGEKFSVGSAILIATEPRMPCYTLAVKIGRPDIIKRFLASERTGFYFAMVQEGEVGAGDSIEIIERIENSLRASDITALYVREKHNVDLHRRAIAVEVIPKAGKNISGIDWRS